MASTEQIQKYLDNHFNKIVEDRYYIECYPECRNTPAWFIKTEPTELEQRENAIQHYLDALLDKFRYCPVPDSPIIAMYIPSHNASIFSNCGKVVSKLTQKIDWLIDGTQNIRRLQTIPAKHNNTGSLQDEATQENTLAITMDVTGKNIMLFDDRITRGNTANQVADLLYSKGANHVWFVAFDLTDRQALFIRTENDGFIVKLMVDCHFIEFELHRSETNEGLKYWYGTNGDSSVRVIPNQRVAHATIRNKEYEIRLIRKQQKKENVWVGKIYEKEQVIL